MEETIVINQENIEKAYKILGVPLAGEEDTSKDIEKGDSDDKVEPEKDKKKRAEDLKKTIEGEDKDSKEKEDKGKSEKKEDKEEDIEKAKVKKSDDDDDDDEDLEKGKKKKEKSSDDKEKDIEKAKDIKKGEDNELLKGLENMFETQNKALDKKFHALGTLEKAFGDQLISLEKQNKEGISNLEKGISDKLNDIDERLSQIEDTPLPKKSFIRKSQVLEKGEQDDINGERKVFSIINNRNEILELLKGKADLDSDTPNEVYIQALLNFEASGNISKSIQNDLKQSDSIDLIK